ncbi:hypothetical protein ACFOQM_03125 [Paenibacillus sp. GCM10012307]|uniref:Uncharacterized protein n=1 Tax=Paenibacillus roseus TaxID=2798579 RepID=A0A934MPD6_9BACL|nr:hypothetical protein [Paenibacillus roseus]MBJ6360309.1 hypothetical protein [Paenibacillus roseus]
MNWLAKFTRRYSGDQIRLALWTTGVLAILVAGAVYSYVQERQGHEVTLMPFTLIVLSVVAYNCFRSSTKSN